MESRVWNSSPSETLTVMTDHVALSPAGARTLRRLAREQSEAHRAIWDFTRDQGLYESHWFDKGFLALFKGDYDAATDDVFASMGEADTGVHRLVERIGEAIDWLGDADRKVAHDMTSLTEVAEGIEPPRFVQGYGGFTNYGGIERPGGKHRGPRTYGSAADTIDAAGSLTSMAHHTDQIAGGVTTDDELEDFVEEHQENVDE